MNTAHSQADSPARLAGRLVSLDTFRGLVILCMLVVNNVGDHHAVGYFWKHADWDHPSFGRDLRAWWASLGSAGWDSLTRFPLFQHCTLADYVMPMFMLIIGIALPFSVASARRHGQSAASQIMHTLRRGATLYLLGWLIGLSLQFLAWRYSTDPGARLGFSLRMDVLQLLGTSYIVARLIYCLPQWPRLAVAAGLFLWHWALLRFYPQGPISAGTFTEANNAVGYIYGHWWIFADKQVTPWLTFSIAGMLSVPPAAATMTLGTWIGETLRNQALGPAARIRHLLVGGLLATGIGIAWSFDLPMNKPRWSPCYLIYCSGVGAMLMAAAYWLVDVCQSRWWTTPLVVLGVNAIGIYFLSIIAKIWLLNMTKVTTANGTAQSLTDLLVSTLQSATTPAAGSWLFTLGFVGTVWLVAALAYKYRIIWKV
jgi:predicted acyltransferase